MKTTDTMEETVRSEKRHSRVLRWIAAALLLIALLAGIVLLTGHIREDMEQKRMEAIREAVESAALQCYVVEGTYPSDLAYLEQHYGVMIDHSRYIVSYEAFASNRAPKVMVLKK